MMTNAKLTKDDGKNKIRIQLPHPATDERGCELAAKANQMLRLLGYPEADLAFEWDERKHCYSMTEGYNQMSRYLEDGGYWVNLDYVAKDTPLGPDGRKAFP